MSYDATASVAKQSHTLAQQTQQRLVHFVRPLLTTLNHQLDVRLVRTFLAMLLAIVQWRNHAHGLLLSELGGYLLPPEQAPAGTKRLSRLWQIESAWPTVRASWRWKARACGRGSGARSYC